jgi:hypothetical protein
LDRIGIAFSTIKAPSDRKSYKQSVEEISRNNHILKKPALSEDTGAIEIWTNPVHLSAHPVSGVLGVIALIYKDSK